MKLILIIVIVVFCTIMGAATSLAMFMQTVWLRRASSPTMDLARYQQEAYERFLAAHPMPK